MAIDDKTRAEILRLYCAEKWKIGTIARQLGVHHSTVDRVLAAAGVPREEKRRRRSKFDPFLPFIRQTLAAYLRMPRIGIVPAPTVVGTLGRLAMRWWRRWLLPLFQDGGRNEQARNCRAHDFDFRKQRAGIPTISRIVYALLRNQVAPIWYLEYALKLRTF